MPANNRAEKNRYKYSGADWMSQSACVQLSPLGVKVADILGQVERGIYHIAPLVLDKREQWSNTESITISYNNELATYDLPQLTALYLCCRRMNVPFSISSKGNSFLYLKFFESPENHYPDLEPDLSVINIGTFADRETGGNANLINWEDDRNQCIGFQAAHSVYTHEMVEHLLEASHRLAIRCSLSSGMGRKKVINIQLNRRNHEMSKRISKRHPTWSHSLVLFAETINALKP